MRMQWLKVKINALFFLENKLVLFNPFSFEYVTGLSYLEDEALSAVGVLYLLDLPHRSRILHFNRYGKNQCTVL